MYDNNLETQIQYRSKPAKKNNMISKLWQHRLLYLFLLPSLVFVIVFNYRPMIGIIMAFQDYDILKGLYGSPFVGIKNFTEFLQKPDFYVALKNTLGINLLALLIAFPMPIVFSIALSELRCRDSLKKIIQSISFLPRFISWVVVAGLFYKFLERDYGLVNLLLEKIGLGKAAFFGDPKYFWGIYIFGVIWKDLGWNAILYLSAMTSISPELYEAAESDGAGRLKKIWHITLPGIMPTIVTLLILFISNFFNSAGMMEPILSLRNAMVANSSDVIDVYALIVGIQQGHYSYAAAIGVAQSVISLLLLAGVNKMLKKITGYSLF